MEFSKVKKEPGIERKPHKKNTTPPKSNNPSTSKNAHHPKTPQQLNNKRQNSKKPTPKTPTIVKVEPTTSAPMANKVQEKKTNVLPPSRPLINKLGPSSGSPGKTSFYVPVPTRSDKENRNLGNIPSSGPSSPFTVQQRAETAGTNFSNMSTSRDVTGGDTTKHMSHISTDRFETGASGNDLLIGLGDVDISMDAEYDGSREEECSPTLNRKRSIIDLDEASKRQKIVNMFNKVKNKMSSIDSEGSMNSNIGVNGGSDFEVTATATEMGKYQIVNQPVYDPIEDESESTYLELIGKTNNECEVELNPNEKEFLEDARLKFDEWIEKGEEINREHLRLTHNAILARMKFNKRFQLVLDNLDEFAVKLEKSGKEINKRSEMLKEYCSKIVNEI